MAENGTGGLVPRRPGFMVYDTTTGDAECYIPIAPDPERTARNMAMWREAGERLGLIPPPNPEADSA